jgi:hypothetical protein
MGCFRSTTSATENGKRSSSSAGSANVSKKLSTLSSATGAAIKFKEQAYRCVGRAPRNTALTPKVRHKVRLVRKEDQATFFLDGKKVLSPNVSDAKGFRDLNLHLAGTWGKEGSVVYFDNLEVRIPPDQNK